jgi:hypothetical protein
MIKPNQVKAAAQKVEDENYDFRLFLKGQDPDELDERFAALHKELFADYDCCQCANCCMSCSIFLDDEDIDRMMSSIIIPRSNFMELYLTKTKASDEKPYKFKDRPCIWIDDDNGTCDIYDRKPHNCTAFPFTDQPNRLQSMYSTIAHAEVCPVVFEILERLKVMYGFRRKRRN